MSEWIIFLGASQDQVAGIRKCQEMGYKVLAFDANPRSPGFLVADASSDISTHDVAAIKEACDPGFKPAGVMTMGSDIPHIVAELAQHFGVPSVSMETAKWCTDKQLTMMRLFYSEPPVPHARFGLTLSPSTARAFGERCGWPIVTKPSDRSGSRGVYRLGPDDDVEKWWLRSKAWSYSGEVIVEEWVEGRQLSTETVMLGGKAVATYISDRNYEHLETFAPLVIENGGWMPTALTRDEHREVEQVIEQAANALGIRDGIAKGDLVYHPTRGPVVIEMACRLSGGDMSESLIPLAHGYDIIGAAVRFSTGKWRLGNLQHEVPDRVICNRYFFPPAGRLVAIHNAEFDAPWLHKLEFWHKPGDTIEPVTHHGNRGGVFVIEAPDRDVMADRIAEVYDTIYWEVESA